MMNLKLSSEKRRRLHDWKKRATVGTGGLCSGGNGGRTGAGLIPYYSLLGEEETSPRRKRKRRRPLSH